MKQNRRTPSRSTKREVHDNFAAKTMSALKEMPARSEDQSPGRDFYVPLSLKTGAGRQHWDEVLGLLVKIRADYDVVADRLGYPSTRDDGLAAVEYIANKILEAVRGERQQHISRPKPQPATRPPTGSRPSFTEYETRHKSAKQGQRASHSERAKLIDDLKQMLRTEKQNPARRLAPSLHMRSPSTLLL
jgi:hypothetical protein